MTRVVEGFARNLHNDAGNCLSRPPQRATMDTATGDQGTKVNTCGETPLSLNPDVLGILILFARENVTDCFCK
jgi:hypothetical protein